MALSTQPLSPFHPFPPQPTEPSVLRGNAPLRLQSVWADEVMSWFGAAGEHVIADQFAGKVNGTDLDETLVGVEQIPSTFNLPGKLETARRSLVAEGLMPAPEGFKVGFLRMVRNLAAARARRFEGFTQPDWSDPAFARTTFDATHVVVDLVELAILRQVGAVYQDLFRRGYMVAADRNWDDRNWEYAGAAAAQAWYEKM
jgi:hypothetical protein